MKKIALAFLVLAIFAFVTPASAGRTPYTVGEKIILLPAYYDPYPPVGLTFNAGAPFYISHGWCWERGSAVGNWDFRLSIDGVAVPDGLRYIQPKACGEMGVVSRIYNFPAGLPAGVHTFEGFWYISCQDGPDPSACTDPNTPVLGLYSNITIYFTAPYP